MATTHNRNNEPTCLKSPGGKRKRPLMPLIDRLSHEFVNQLTVINLSCFRIQAIVPADVLAELDCIDKAVTELTKLIASLPTKHDIAGAAGSCRTPPSSTTEFLTSSLRKL